MAFVVPAEIGHATYAAPLLEYLVANFELVQIVAVRTKLFPELAEDCWLLYAAGHGGRTNTIRFSAIETFKPRNTERPPPGGRAYQSRNGDRCGANVCDRLSCQQRPAASTVLLLSMEAQSELGAAASVGIGYVSGANDFFHLRPSTIDQLGIPAALLHPTVRNGRALPSHQLTLGTIKKWRAADEAMMLLRLPKAPKAMLPASVRRYLDSAAGVDAREAYKCRVRDPWFSVPDVQIPDYFLSYMSGVSASLVRNAGGATCTNSVHGVRVRNAAAMKHVVKHWSSAFVTLSREIEGHPLGGGMLKLEPREASQILIPAETLLAEINAEVIAGAVTAMQRWRHYA